MGSGVRAGLVLPGSHASGFGQGPAFAPSLLTGRGGLEVGKLAERLFQ